MLSEPDHLSAEDRFREAFERLKADKPTLLKRETPVSQNNVAKEAGCDPSALRKARFPSLIREIQAYVELHRQERLSKRQERIKQRMRRADLQVRIAQLSAERDEAQSKLASAHRRIVELNLHVKALKEKLDELLPPPSTLNR